jgi:hypothetical protein
MDKFAMRNPGHCVKKALNFDPGRTRANFQRRRAFATRRRPPNEHKFINILGKAPVFLMVA